MPRVADYSILTDQWWTEGFSPNPIEFTIPNNISKDSRSILGFMLGRWNDDEMTLRIRLNSITVWERKFSSNDSASYAYWQEVIPKGLAVPGTNRLTIDSNSDDFRWTAVSDVVFWWQADI